MFKFNLGQEVWYLLNNKLHKATVLARKYVDNVVGQSIYEFGINTITYNTVHGTFLENEVYASLDDLIAGLKATSVMLNSTKENE